MKRPSDLTTYEYPFFDNIKESKKKLKETKSKYKVGDLVNVMYEVPHTMNGKKQNTTNFRMGDLRLEKEKRKIKTVLNYSGFQPYRYLVLNHSILPVVLSSSIRRLKSNFIFLLNTTPSVCTLIQLLISVIITSAILTRP